MPFKYNPFSDEMDYYADTLPTIKLTNLTDGYVPYHVSDAVGLADSVIQANTTGIGIGIAPAHNNVFGMPDAMYVTGTTIFARDLDVDTAYFVRYGSNSITNYDVSHNNDVGGVAYKVGLRNTANVLKNYEVTVKMASLAGDSDVTLTDQIGIFVEQNLKGSTGAGVLTVNNAYGILCGPQIVGSLNNCGIRVYGPTGAASNTNYGIMIDAPTGATTANIGLYNAGTLVQNADAYVSGNLKLGDGWSSAFVSGLTKLHVESQSSVGVLVKTLSDTIGETSNLSFVVSSGSTIKGYSSRSADIKVTRVSGSSFDMGFYCSNSTTNAEILHLLGLSGFVGICTSSPVARLEVEDDGTSASMLVKITQDNQDVYGLVIGNDSYSTTDTNGLAFKVLDTGAPTVSWTAGVLTLDGDTYVDGDLEVTGAIKEVFKVGSYYFNSTGVNPATELGYGTWTQVAQGQFLIGAT